MYYFCFTLSKKLKIKNMIIEKWEYRTWHLKANPCYWRPEYGLKEYYDIEYCPEWINSWITSLNIITSKLHNTCGLGKKVDITMSKSTFDLLQIIRYCWYYDETNKIGRNYNLVISDTTPDNIVFIIIDDVLKGKIEIVYVERSCKEWFELLIKREEDKQEEQGEKVFRNV